MTNIHTSRALLDSAHHWTPEDLELRALRYAYVDADTDAERDEIVERMGQLSQGQLKRTAPYFERP